MTVKAVDLDALRRDADRWLQQQRSDRALDVFAVAYFKRHFCLPWFVVEALARDEEKETAR